MRMRWVGAVLGLVLAAPAGAATLALVGGTLVDGTLREPIRDSVILVDGERIVAVGTVDTLPVPAGVEVVSTEGMTVLPGLWDMHVHLMINGHADYDYWDRTYLSRLRATIMPASAAQLLMAGVTSARDLGGPLEDSIAVRDAINAGEIPGPTMYVSGPFIQKKPYPGGVDGFEHTGFAAAPEFPEDVMDALAERTANMALGPLFWTPTIEGLYNFPYTVRNHEFIDSDSWHRGLTPEIVADIRGSLAHPERISYFQQTPQRQPTLQRKFEQLRGSGVVLLVGTDSGIPMKFHSQSTWNELDVWVNRFGVPAIDAIRAATYWPAVAMKVDADYGTVTEGKYADIVAVRGDALRQVALLQDVDVVVKHGRRVR